MRTLTIVAVAVLLTGWSCSSGESGTRSDAGVAPTTDPPPAPTPTPAPTSAPTPAPAPIPSSAPDPTTTAGASTVPPAPEAAPSFVDPTSLTPFPLLDQVDLGVPAARLRSGADVLFAVTPGGDTVHLIDPGSGVVTRSVDLPGEPNPDIGTFLGFFSGDLWVMNGDLDRLSRLDADTLELTTDIPIPTSSPSGNYWIQPAEQLVVNGYGDDEVVHLVDPSTNTIQSTFDVPRADGSLVAFDSIWITNIERGTVTRIPIASPEDRSVIDVGGTPGMIAATADAIWVLDRRNGSVTPIDPVSAQVGEAVVLLPGATSAFVGGFAEDGDGRIVVSLEATEGPPLAGLAVIDPATGEVCNAGLLPSGTLPGGLQSLGPAVYLLLVPVEGDNSTLARLDTSCR